MSHESEPFEVVDPRFRSFVLPNARLETLADGFRWLEGPVWFADQNRLLFNDLPNDRTMAWSPGGGVEVFRKPSCFANGQTRDRAGRLLSCSHQRRAVLRTELDGRITVVADRFEERQLNSPNDIVAKSDGSIWFSDPHYGIETDYEGGKGEPQLPPRVYRVDPQDGSLTIAVDGFQGPNGLCFSPDETRLYVAETGINFAPDPVQEIRVFDVVADGRSLANERRFHKVKPGAADGFRADTDGNLWCSAADGVHCISPDGELLGKIKVPSRVSNLAFGDRFKSRLFICGSQTLYSIFVNRRGAQTP